MPDDVWPHRALVPDEATISQFIHSLFRTATVGQVEFNAIREGVRPKARQFKLDDLEAAIQFCVTYSENGWGVYVSAGLRDESLKHDQFGKIDHVVGVAAIKIDIDEGDRFEEALERLDHFKDLEPNFIAQTASYPNFRGHFWWILDEPTVDFKQVVSIETQLIEFFHADPATKDIRRVMRVPGTINFPGEAKLLRGRRQEQVKLLRRRAATYSIEELASVVARHVPQPERAGQQEKPAAASGANAGLTKGADLLANLRHGNWHNNMRDYVARLVGLGAHDDEIIELLVSRGLPEYSSEQTKAELQQFVSSARQKFGHKPKDDAEPEISGVPEPSAWAWKDPSKFPQFPWIYRDLYARGYLTITVSPGGLGKSTLCMTEALAMSLGKDLLSANDFTSASDIPPHSVWYLNLEDSQDLIDRRLAGVCKHYGISADQICGRLFTNSTLGKQFHAAKEIQREARINLALFEDLKRHISDNKIDLILIDPFVSSHGLNENDNNQIDMVAKRWSALANELTIGVGMVHHTRKQNGLQFDAESARGAKSLTDAARIVRVLNKEPKQEEAVPYPVTIFSAEIAKTNLSRSGKGKTYFQIQEVSLCNVSVITDDGLILPEDPSDTVGVIAPWEFIEIVAPEEFDNEQLCSIREAITGGEFRLNQQADDWIGYEIAKILNLSVETKPEKREMNKSIQNLISARFLETYSKKGKKGRESPYVRLAGEVPEEIPHSAPGAEGG